MTTSAERMLEGIRTILRVFTIDQTRFPPAEGRVKYNAVDFQTLYYIDAQPGCNSTELANFLGIAQTSTQSVCDRLIRRGYLTRENSERNRRAVALSLTEEGLSVVEAIRRQDLANCETMLRALSPGSRRAFVAQIVQIADSLAE